MNNQKYLMIKRSLLSMSIASICMAANAQENNDFLNKTQLQPITVTARGITEDNLSTPFSVNIINGLETKERQLLDVKDMLRTQPSVDMQLAGNAAFSILTIRGVGGLYVTNLDDNAINFKVDGISNGKIALNRNLIDIDTIEIAKGPQGTISGTRSEAGSITVKTNDPVDYLEGNVTVGAGNKSQKNVQGVLNLPLTNNFALRIAGMSDSRDADLRKNENGKPINTKKKEGIQAKLGWHDDNNKHKVVLNIYHDKQTNNVPLYYKESEPFHITTFNLPNSAKDITKGIGLNVKSDLGFADFTSQTSFQKYEGTIHRPRFYTFFLEDMYKRFKIPQNQFAELNQKLSEPKNNRRFEEYSSKDFSQEFKLSSKPNDKMQWVTGVFLSHKKQNIKQDYRISLADFPNTPEIQSFKNRLLGKIDNADFSKETTIDQQAIFGEVTYPLTEKLNLITGLRFTHEKQKQDEIWIPNANNTNPLAKGGVKTGSNRISDNAFTGRLGLNYAIMPELHVYALQSHDHKFGGFDMYDTSMVNKGKPFAYEPTSINTSEIGAKYQSNDGKLMLGLALFQTKMKDDRIRLYTPAGYSAASVDTRSRGIELNGDWQANDNLKLYAALDILNTKVTSAPEKAKRVTQEGNEKPQVPKFSSTVGLVYHDELSVIPNGYWFTDINYRYVGTRYSQADNKQKLDAYHLVNLNIGLGNDQHELVLWGKNIANKKYLQSGMGYNFAGIEGLGVYGPERTFGIKYSYKF